MCGRVHSQMLRARVILAWNHPVSKKYSLIKSVWDALCHRADLMNCCSDALFKWCQHSLETSDICFMAVGILDLRLYMLHLWVLYFWMDKKSIWSHTPPAPIHTHKKNKQTKRSKFGLFFVDWDIWNVNCIWNFEWKIENFHGENRRKVEITSFASICSQHICVNWIPGMCVCMNFTGSWEDIETLWVVFFSPPAGWWPT